ncbi:hypothetical protein [Paenibacillus cymbidii]|uniref:hypothetical protein n=1 Tax=Paenibacillus cymbidii TaxID=1639034 RepID=UPI0010801D7F|nr:hypothetical protein [Paenibacillus cymbidii]
MNPGTISFVLISAALIFVLSGWKDVWLKGLSLRFILLFLAAWSVLAFFELDFAGYTIHLAVLPVAAFAAVAVMQAGSPAALARYCGVGGMLGALLFMLHESTRLAPAFAIVHQDLDPALLVSLLLVIFYRQPKQQLTALSIGWLVAGLFTLMLHRQQPSVSLGDLHAQDEWWLMAWMSRLMAVTVEQTYKTMKRTIAGWATRRK